MAKKYFLLAIVATIITFSSAEDAFYNINSKKILHKVSDKFLSISIDPAVLLAGANLSDASLGLVKHLSPAYIRLAGPSTPFVKYLDNEEEVFLRKDMGSNVYVTPSMWFGINEWFNLANLTPVFGLNDGDTVKGVWDPQSTIPLLEMSDKFGVACYWQLGYAGCSNNKSMLQYVEDLNILRQTLNGFAEHNDTWRIVGSDLSSCMSDSTNDNYIRNFDENIDAIMWRSQLIPKSNLGLTKAALWASIPKDTQPVTFSSAIDWASKVGQAAALEYDVIFREPRLVEFTQDTPVYWFSFLYKKLMGTNVLEIKTAKGNTNLFTYAHCTRRQSDFVRSGAVTVLMVNNGSETCSANVRLGNILLEKSMEVQSYLLQASNESSSKVLLNDHLLTMDMLQRPNDILKPKLRRARILTHISLEIPPQTIGFFVLTGAKYGLCTKNEDEFNAILAEINQEQNDSLSSEESSNAFIIKERMQDDAKKYPLGYKATLEDIKKNILEEMEQDKLYYDKTFSKPKENKNNSAKQAKEAGDDYKREMLHDHLKSFIKKSRKNNLKTDTKPTPNMHLTIQEIENIIKQRARDKAAAKNIKLTSAELDMLVDKATLVIPKHFVAKRDINRLLLEEKANFYKNNIFNQEIYEQRAKERKLLPNFKFRRSINTPLLNLKAIMEENKKYLLNRNKAHARSGRDINLDLLRKRSEHGRGKIIKNNKKSKYDDNVLSLDGQKSEELFDDLLQFEEKIFEDFTSPRHSFANLDSLDLDEIDEEFFKKPKSKNKSLWQPRLAEEYVVSDEQPCVEKFELASFSPRNKQKSRVEFREMSAKKKKSESPCFSLDDINFSDDLDYGFFRRKRSTAVAKQELRNKEKHLKSHVQKLRKEIKQEKIKYLKEKVENKKKRKHYINNNIQIIPKKQANSNENTVLPPLQHNIKKRSLLNNDFNNIFGKYKPLTPTLKAWKPSDILNLHKNTFLNWPLYSWVQDQNLKNELLRRNYLMQFGLRKRRHIDDNNFGRNDLFFGKKTDSRKKKKHIIEEVEMLRSTTTERTVTIKNGRSISYLEKVLGKKKVQAFQEFYKNTQESMNVLNKSVKDFLYNLF